MADTYDIIVIGGGPGGYVAAIRAAQLGFKTAVVEREHLGGICLNWGCIPTKALLRSAEIFHYMQHARITASSAEKVGFDAAAIVQRSRGVSGRLNGGVGMLLKKNKVDVIWGEAAIPKPGEIVVGQPRRPPMQPQSAAPKGTLGAGTYQAKHIIVATGARPARDPRHRAGRKADLDLFRGHGAGGDAEVAPGHGLGRHRHRVRLLLPHHGRRGDGGGSAAPDPARRGCRDRGLARKRFEKQGIKILTGAKVTKVEKAADCVTATIEGDGKSRRPSPPSG